MSSFPRHHGIIVPIVTPVHADGSLDEASATRLVEHLASHHCGMLVLGTTGEVASLPAALRRRYVELAVKTAARRVPVFAAAVNNAPSEAIAAGNDYLNAGADAVVGLLPNYYKLEPAEMLGFFNLLAEGLRGPLYLYNIPSTTGMSLPLDVIEQLSARKNIIGVKDSENTEGRREQLARRLGGRDDFALFMGVAAHTTPALKLGFAGAVPSSGNLLPDRWHSLYTAAKRGDWATAEALQTKLDALNGVFQRNRTLGQSLAALKAALAARGLCETHMAPPLRPLDGAAIAQVQAEVAALDL